MLRFYVDTVEINWDNIPAKQFVKIRSDCLEYICRIMYRWKNTAISCKI
jgi:hypothetical protein